MKIWYSVLAFTMCTFASLHSFSQTGKSNSTANKTGQNLYIDVHQLEPGKVKFEDVVKAHSKDLAVQKKYGVDFLKFWVDENKGLVYCLSAATDSSAIRKTHAAAHGLLPSLIYPVTAGQAAEVIGNGQLFLDIHELGAGNVTVKDVAAAHQKDLVTQKKYGVNFINYWVDEKNGTVFCLSQALDSNAIINTHREAHGLLPKFVLKVKQGE